MACTSRHVDGNAIVEGTKNPRTPMALQHTSSRRPKVLFFGEGATLAHVVRPLALACELDPNRFEVVFCRPAAVSWLTRDAHVRVLDLECQAGSVFAHRLAKLSPLYDFETLRRYVDNDLALIDAVQPDVVIGDFRLSLGVSARLRTVPYIALCDVYWSPEYRLPAPLPVLSWTPYVPVTLIEPAFSLATRYFSRFHARPFEQLRAHFGLPSLGFNLQRCYSDADLRLFASIPLLFQKVSPAADAAFIGPITGFPMAGDYPILSEADGPLAYVTMGSSGDPRLIATLLPLLDELGCRAIVATAGKSLPFKPTSPRMQIFEYVPGDVVCRHSHLVVCNGGSATANQALSNGIPVLGLAQNMDQFLNMQAVERYGAGLLVRADRASPSRLRIAMTKLLQQRQFTDRAQELAASVAHQRASSILADHVLSLCSRRHGTSLAPV